MFSKLGGDMKKDVLAVVKESMIEIDTTIAQEFDGKDTNDIYLYGNRGHFDSIGLVSVIVAIERNVKDRFGKSITLSDQRAMSQKNSPFKTVESMVDYITTLLGEK